MLEKLKKNILDIIFPPRCVGCGHLGDFICPECMSLIIKIKNQSCPICHRIGGQGRLCPTCAPKSKLTGVVAFGYFKDPILKEAIHQFKYEELTALKSILGEMIMRLLADMNIEHDYIAYVPISSKRLRERGYNQAEILAQQLATHSKKPILKGLTKNKHTKRQVGLKRGERLKNLSGCFSLKSSQGLRGKKILLIDDVLTTGATLDECAKVLRGAGAKQVWGVVLARE